MRSLGERGSGWGARLGAGDPQEGLSFPRLSLGVQGKLLTHSSVACHPDTLVSSSVQTQFRVAVLRGPEEPVPTRVSGRRRDQALDFPPSEQRRWGARPGDKDPVRRLRGQLRKAAGVERPWGISTSA